MTQTARRFAPIVLSILRIMSALLLIGLFTRPVAFILAGHLAFAYFLGHAPKGFYPLLNGGEVAVLYCFVFLYIACAGGGPLSVDARRGRSRR